MENMLYYFDPIPIASQTLINCSVTCSILGIPRLLHLWIPVPAARFTPQSPCHGRSQLIHLTLAFLIRPDFFCFFYGLADALIDLVSPLMWLGNWHRLKRRTRRQTLRGRQCQKADRSWKNRQFQKRTGDEFRDRNGCVK